MLLIIISVVRYDILWISENSNFATPRPELKTLLISVATSTPASEIVLTPTPTPTSEML